MKTALTGLKNLFMTKSWWTFILMIATAIAAKKGFDVDARLYWTIVGGFAVLLGVHGASDWSNSSSTATLQTLGTPITGELMSTAAATDKVYVHTVTPITGGQLVIMNDGSHKIVPVTEATDIRTSDQASKQAGFARLNVMVVLAAICVMGAIAFSVGCGAWSSTAKTEGKAAGHDLSVCAKAEYDAVKNNTSIIDVALGIYHDIEAISKDSSAATGIVEGALVKYGEPLVACTYNKIKAAHTSTLLGARPDPIGIAAQEQIEKHATWARYAQ